MMNDTNWLKIKEVFNQTLDLPESERDEYLSSFEESIHLEVSRLLESHEKLEDFIAEPIALEIGLDVNSNLGKTIGSYKLLSLLGTGGMGQVFLAEKEGLDKKFALKLIKRGMDTEAVLKRFVRERQILSRLEHPNIAQILDAGSTDDGLPYFVMEYIEGETLTKFCDTHQLETKERLEIFQKVCEAIKYAHQNLIVHRDIKPSNILVTADETPKLLDFGVAKLLSSEDDDKTTTALQSRMFTPEYASPEQINGLPMTTATDVYSLGVVLYELLSGTRPFNSTGKSYQEIVSSVLSEEPVRPSSVVSRPSLVGENATSENKEPRTKDEGLRTKSLKGDLDNIILKSLRKEPDRRYQSIQEFSEDIRRFSVGLPVTATADSLRYRLSKFVKRHQKSVAAGSLISLLIFAISGIAIWQAIVANNERIKAEQRFNDVRQITNSLLFDFHNEVKDLPGATGARAMVVTKALEYLDILAKEQSDDLLLQFELANAYAKVGAIQGFPGSSNLGDTSGAISSYQKSIEILKKLVQAEPTNRQFQTSLAAKQTALATIFSSTGEMDQSLEMNLSSKQIFENLLSNDPTSIEMKIELADCHKGIADIIAGKGNLEEAMKSYQKALEISETVVEVKPNDKNVQIMVIVALDSIGATLGNPNFTNLSDTEGALKTYQRALKMCDKILENDETSRFGTNAKALVLREIGEVKAAQGEWKEAIDFYNQSLGIQEKLVVSDEKDAAVKEKLAYLFTNLGEALANSKQFDSALRRHEQAIEILENLNEKDSGKTQLITYLGRAFKKKADSLVQQGRIEEAIPIYHKKLKAIEKLTDRDVNNMDIRLLLGQTYLMIAKANAKLAENTQSNRDTWRESLKYFNRSGEIFNYMKTKGLKLKQIDDFLAEVNQGIEKCQTNLKN